MKNKWRKILILIAVILAVCFTGLFVVSHAVYHRSAKATIFECCIKVLNNGELRSTEKTEATMATLAEEEEPLCTGYKEVWRRGKNVGF